MAEGALVPETMAKKFAGEKDTPDVRWVQAEGLDIIAATTSPISTQSDLKPWERRGGRGIFINHEASRTSNDCYICEIPRQAMRAPQRQLFEEMILVLSGRRLHERLD